MMVVGGKIVIGNDGGVYSRPLSDNAEDGNWADLNATLHDLQFYDARAEGQLSDGTTQVVGGLQDNGSMVDNTAFTQSAEAAGGDGFDVIVDPANANNWVGGEYTDGTLYSTTDGGHSFFSNFVSFSCAGQATVGQAPNANCDPNARFVMPLVQDQRNAGTWVGGGEDVWVSHDGWSTSCASEATCTWTPVYDTGSGHAVTALSSAGDGKVIYAAWVAGGGNPGPAFASGIATNYGGTWHQVSTAGLPNRYIAGVTVDPANPAHAYAVFNGYSRRFVPGGGTQATSSRQPTAARPGPTSPATCRTSPPTPWCSPTASSPWPPTPGCTPPPGSGAPAPRGATLAPDCRTLRSMT